jgi:hypothetical protein
MRSTGIEHLAAGGVGLDPRGRDAFEKLRAGKRNRISWCDEVCDVRYWPIADMFTAPPNVCFRG